MRMKASLARPEIDIEKRGEKRLAVKSQKGKATREVDGGCRGTRGCFFDWFPAIVWIDLRKRKQQTFPLFSRGVMIKEGCLKSQQNGLEEWQSVWCVRREPTKKQLVMYYVAGILEGALASLDRQVKLLLTLKREERLSFYPRFSLNFLFHIDILAREGLESVRKRAFYFPCLLHPSQGKGFRAN